MAGMSPAGNIPSGASDQEKVCHSYTHVTNIFLKKNNLILAKTFYNIYFRYFYLYLERDINKSVHLFFLFFNKAYLQFIYFFENYKNTKYKIQKYILELTL